MAAIVASRQRSAVSVIEAAYQLEGSDEAWLDGLVASVESKLDHGFGVCGYTYDARQTPLRIERLRTSARPVLEEVVRAAVEMSSRDEEYVDRTWRSQSLATVSQTVDMQSFEPAAGFVAAGMNDIFVINAYDLSGAGVWLGAPMAEARPPTEAERRTWQRVTSHLAAAHRLRCRTQASRPPSAVFTSAGRLEHAEGAAREQDAREALREAVLRREHARSLDVADEDRALGEWRPLIEAQWSLLDHFEHGGRRYVVAVENEVQLAAPAPLTARERQVVAAAAAERSTKVIAYELGLSDSTVRVLLARAARKLGVATRRELVAVYRAHRKAMAGEQGQSPVPGEDRGEAG